MIREPLIHISQRLPGSQKGSAGIWRNIIVYAVSILLALLVCAGLLLALTGLNPIKVYVSLWNGAFGTTKMTWETLRNTAILLIISFAVMPAFRMRYWNIGADGQVLVAACATAGVLILGKDLPRWLLYTLCPVAGIIAGTIWAVIPALFKARWKTNETLFTLMMNYVATQIVAYCIVFWENPTGSNSIGLINMKGKIGWLPNLFGNSSLLVVLIVIAVIILWYIYLAFSKHGYEVSVVGGSERTAAYIGINVKRVIIRTMALCGATAGIAGYLLTAGVGHTLSTGMVAGRGFTAIIVAWLGKMKPVYMALIALLLVFMQRGSSMIATDFCISKDVTEVVTGILLFFILAADFFIHYEIHLRRHTERGTAKA